MVTNRSYTFSQEAALSCPLSHNCLFALLHILYITCCTIADFFQDFIAHAQTAFPSGSDRVKLVVEEVKNQLFEGTTKWPMAADS